MAHLMSQPKTEGEYPTPQRNPRQKYCDLVVTRGRKIARELLRKQEWRRIFNDVPESQARHKLSQESAAIASLRNTAQELEKELAKFSGSQDQEPLLVVAIDEVSNLLRSKTGDETTGLYGALGRIISCLKDFRIWWFFLSTEYKVDRLLPVDTFDYQHENFVEKPSSREVLGTSGPSPAPKHVLRRIPPFFGFQLHIGIKRKMLEARETELGTTIANFATPRHMALFGRPLWAAFHENPEHMHKLAKSKIIGGARKFDPANPHHVFSVMSTRLSLDVCIQNPVSLPLSRMAVNSSLRVITGINQDLGILETMSPPEPVVAKAAFEHLRGRPGTWSDALRTLTGDLLAKGLVSKGLKGELFARLVLILASDIVRSKEFVSTYTVRDFLLALFGEQHRHEIEKLDRELLDAVMNFSSITATTKGVEDSKEVPALYRDLLSHMVGLQLAPNQKMFDIVIPCHSGKGVFDPSKCMTIGIQVKNRLRKSNRETVFNARFVPPEQVMPTITRPRESSRSFQHPLATGNKRLVMLLDLDPEAPSPDTPSLSVMPMRPDSAKSTWSIQASGHTGKVYGCLKTMGCEEVANQFFDMVTRSDEEPDIHDRIADSNWTFKEVQEKFRYGDVTAEGGPGTAIAKKRPKRGHGQSSRAEASGSGSKSKKLKTDADIANDGE